jgi:hypothetical protein
MRRHVIRIAWLRIHFKAKPGAREAGNPIAAALCIVGAGIITQGVSVTIAAATLAGHEGGIAAG